MPNNNGCIMAAAPLERIRGSGRRFLCKTRIFLLLAVSCLTFMRDKAMMDKTTKGRCGPLTYELQHATVFWNGAWERRNITISDGMIVSGAAAPDVVFPFDNCLVLPGFTDVHVHFREPGFCYKETIATGTAAAARGGYTTVCTMPNLNPVPDSMANLAPQLEAIRQTARVHVHPYGAITVGRAGERLAALDELAEQVCAFSDDGSGVQDDEVMRRAMCRARELGKIIAAHCEDNRLLRGGYIHDGDYARTHGHKGICSESEWGQIARDLELVRQTGCAYHVCHVSTKESVALIRRAKAEGLDVTCETAPHYLVLTDADLREDGRFKMNPPLRSAEDRAALLEGLRDGTIDMIASDHAPHSAEEKAKGLAGSAMGVVGLETAFPVLYTALVRPGLLTIEQLIALMHDNPNRRFSIGDALREGVPANLAVWDLTRQYPIDPASFQSKGRSTPFAGWTVWGACRMTFCDGKPVWGEVV